MSCGSHRRLGPGRGSGGLRVLPARRAAADGGERGILGGRLDIQLDFQTPQSFVGQRDPDLAAALLIPAGAELPVGSLLRLRGSGPAAAGEFHWVAGLGRDTAGKPLITVDPPADAIGLARSMSTW